MWYQKRQNKMGAIKQTYNGYSYMSKKEASKAFELDILVKSGEIKSWERQVKISIDVNGYHICNYFVDFLIHHNDDSLEYLEIKGFATDVWRLKWKLFEAFYGDKEGVKLTVER